MNGQIIYQISRRAGKTTMAKLKGLNIRVGVLYKKFTAIYLGSIMDGKIEELPIVFNRITFDSDNRILESHQKKYKSFNKFIYTRRNFELQKLMNYDIEIYGHDDLSNKQVYDLYLTHLENITKILNK